MLAMARSLSHLLKNVSEYEQEKGADRRYDIIRTCHGMSLF
jgi:hypothetical protein